MYTIFVDEGKWNLWIGVWPRPEHVLLIHLMARLAWSISILYFCTSPVSLSTHQTPLLRTASKRVLTGIMTSRKKSNIYFVLKKFWMQFRVPRAVNRKTKISVPLNGIWNGNLRCGRVTTKNVQTLLELPLREELKFVTLFVVSSKFLIIE